MYPSDKRAVFIQDWERLYEETPLPVRQAVSDMIVRHAAELSDLFYSSMLSDPDARIFLSHDLVNQRLHGSMQRWLVELFTLEQLDPAEVYHHQCHVGEVHARIQIPFVLVMKGARLLRQAASGHLASYDLDSASLVRAANYIYERMELALDAMTDYYVTHMEKHARVDESYRMFSLGQNMVAERERQRAALLEWAQQILLGLVANVDDGELPSFKHSEFGMWLQHKASIVFESAPELEQIRSRIGEIEDSMMHQISAARGKQEDTRQLMKEIDKGIGEIKFLLGGLFDRFIEVESGRDALTRLLNRRYLPSVLTREMSMARRNNMPFALLLLDLDHFKAINDNYGHSAGDMVLQHAADLVSGGVRAGDFVFRYGGEELLVVLVEISREKAMDVAESLRQKFMDETFHVGEGGTIGLTVSIGIATYSGHPDYETMIKDADGALYQAKEQGRNCCVLSER